MNMNMSTKKAISDALSYNWEITFPDGHKEQIKNLNVFCKTHNLNR